METVRTPDGPRQRTVCYLGELNHSAQARWLKAIEVFNEQGECRQLKLLPSDVEPPENDSEVVRVRVNQVRFERVRQFGTCFLGLELWKRLGLDRLFEGILDQEGADVPWSRVAALLAINRLCAPSSELGIEQRWYPATALDDLLGFPAGVINDTRLYRCLDRLLPHKTKLEQHLKQRYGELFAADFDVLLYDLTSSYVEGQAEKNPMLQRGYSRDHRPDCKQVVIALIVNAEGFPFSYETFDGDRADVTTLETVMRMVERKYGRARRVWVFDRGIVSEENLASLRKRGGKYLVGTPRSKLKKVEKELLEGGWTQVRDEVEAKLVPTPNRTETYVLCRSTARREKERAIRRRFSSRIEKALKRLEQQVEKGRLKDRQKMERRLGKIQARHPQVSDLYEMGVIEREGRLAVEWKLIDDRQTWREAREGAYLLRTNLEAETTEELWTKYIQLTEAEAVFRALKSELLIRPLFHQLEPRVKAHILVAFLGYAMWVTLKHLLRRTQSDLSPAQALALLSTLQSADIVLPTTDGREIRLRRIATPDPHQQRLLAQLGIVFPEHFNLNFECSADSAIA
ncbi:MAG TPA: IS1634 family transposase [Terriglobales bacterium]|nr:IS1634 family transposase [Terriglobales bacterium]